MSQTKRRLFFAMLIVASVVALSAIMIVSLSKGGFTAAEAILLACFIITLPWTTIGFWNAVIGFGLLQFTKNPASYVFPDAETIDGNEDITASTAIAMCIRNEEVSQVYRNLNAMMARLVASDVGKRFHVYVLSDSFETTICQEEERQFSKLKREWAGRIDVTYRRREDNAGFKAGNIADFCERWGKRHDFMLTLDADSVMSASAILRLVRIMQKNDHLGILQSLVVGLPSDSAFTRVFQFGMRMGMKSYTLGSAWWQADCGPYWGHNALIRLKPFIEECHLPKIPGNGPLSGWILSHDQVEAVFMRRAGYECRVLVEEGGSFEENPPHILEFIRRDLRWCHGNMQYFKLLAEPDLKLTSRIQLVLAILMFIGSPAWMVFVVVAAGALIMPDIVTAEMQVEGPGYFLFATIMTMVFAPKIVTVLDVLLRADLRKAYGGGAAVFISALTEVVFSMLLAPIMAIANTIFLFQLFVLRKAKGWTAQSRIVQSLPIKSTITHLWPQLIFGTLGFGAIYSGAISGWVAIAMCVPVFVGPLVAIPFALATSHVGPGRLAARLGLWQLPEEMKPPVIIRALHLPAVQQRAISEDMQEQYQPLSTQELLDIGSDFDSASAVGSTSRIAA